MALTPLQEAVKEVGNPTALAKAIGRRQSTVWDWMKRGWPAPNACHDIEAATGGKVKANDLLKPAMGPKRRKAA